MKNWKVKMWYSVKSYLKFLLNSSNHHGVHSPFVYDFVTKCLYDKTVFEDYSTIVHYIKALKASKDSLTITDFGAGSRVFKSDTRKISSIAKHAGSTIKEAKLLYRIANYFKPQSILELGTSLGIATQALSLGSKNSKMTTIEGCPNISKFTQSQFEQLNLTNIELITSDFQSVLPKLVTKTHDLVYFDGHHQKDATIQYFESLLPTAHNDSVWIFDDIYWSKEMTEAWQHIKKHPKVTVTIDTFHFGFIFFRKEQAKEDFMIRL